MNMPATDTTKPVIDTSADGANIIEQILSEGSMVRGGGDDQKKHARDIIGEFVHQIVDEKMKIDQGAVAAIQERIAQIDDLIGRQLDAVLHAPEFQYVEARWRGLHYLVMNSETGTRLKIRVLNVKKDELRKDFEASPEFDRSSLFKKLYEEEALSAARRTGCSSATTSSALRTRTSGF
jgi:type VI secretion system protein ImpC